MQKRLAILSLLVLPFTVSAQLGGEATYQFLNLASAPRQAALGGKVLTNYDYDVTQALFNPATINMDMHNQLSVNYSSYLGGISYGTAAYAFTYDRHVQTFHAGVTYINYGRFDGYDELGNPTGTFSGGEAAVSLGYAYNIPWTDFYLGANLKLINSKLEQYSSFGIAADLGAMYIDERLGFRAAITIRNLGTQLSTFAGTREKLPLEIDLGFSQQLENVPIRWHLTLENLQRWNISASNPARVTTDLDGTQTAEEMGLLKTAIRHLIVGAEIFPEGDFNIRLGYNFRRAEELRILEQRNFSGLSVGFAFKMNKLRFSYTHARYSGASNASFFGLIINLNRP